jgi:hypothetical protein
LKRAQVAAEDIEVVRVPGARDPLAGESFAASGRFSGRGLRRRHRRREPPLGLPERTVTGRRRPGRSITGVPVTNAVLTTETLEQAVARSTGRGATTRDTTLPAAVEHGFAPRFAGGGRNGKD